MIQAAGRLRLYLYVTEVSADAATQSCVTDSMVWCPQHHRKQGGWRAWGHTVQLFSLQTTTGQLLGVNQRFHAEFKCRASNISFLT